MASKSYLSYVSEYKCANCANDDCPGMIKTSLNADDYQASGYCPDNFYFVRSDE